MNNTDFLKKGLTALKLNIDNEKIIKLLDFMEIVLEKNKTMNLTAITEPEDFITKHIIDSLSILKHIENNSYILDIGTGGGFPGIPLKLAEDSLKILLTDSIQKKINFVKEAIDYFSLKNAEALCIRAEELGRTSNRGTFDYVTARAVSSMSVLIEYALPLLKKNGKLIAMKGANTEEKKAYQNALKELGGKLIEEDIFTLPNTDMKRHIIIIEKINDTNFKYPRKTGIPLKKPL